MTKNNSLQTYIFISNITQTGCGTCFSSPFVRWLN